MKNRLKKKIFNYSHNIFHIQYENNIDDVYSLSQTLNHGNMIEIGMVLKNEEYGIWKHYDEDLFPKINWIESMNNGLNNGIQLFIK